MVATALPMVQPLVLVMMEVLVVVVVAHRVHNMRPPLAACQVVFGWRSLLTPDIADPFCRHRQSTCSKFANRRWGESDQ